MKLITKELENLLKEYPIHSQDGKGGNAKVLAKFFNPVGVGTWYITEAKKEANGKYLFYGYCHLGDDRFAELGYVTQVDLENLKLPFGLTIERDLYMPKDICLKDAIRRDGFIVPSYLIGKKHEYER